MQLAERGTFLGGEVWVREIRKLTGSGHQTSILATDYRLTTARQAPLSGGRRSPDGRKKISSATCANTIGDLYKSPSKLP
jgi:hypothetical protein